MNYAIDIYSQCIEEKEEEKKPIGKLFHMHVASHLDAYVAAQAFY